METDTHAAVAVVREKRIRLPRVARRAARREVDVRRPHMTPSSYSSHVMRYCLGVVPYHTATIRPCKGHREPRTDPPADATTTVREQRTPTPLPSLNRMENYLRQNRGYPHACERERPTVRQLRQVRRMHAREMRRLERAGLT